MSPLDHHRPAAHPGQLPGGALPPSPRGRSLSFLVEILQQLRDLRRKCDARASDRPRDGPEGQEIPEPPLGQGRL